MTDAPLPGWAATAKSGASAAVSTFGAVFVVRWTITTVDVVFRDGSWGDRPPLWLAVIAAVCLGLAIILGGVWIVGEFVAGTRTPRS